MDLFTHNPAVRFARLILHHSSTAGFDPSRERKAEGHLPPGTPAAWECSNSAAGLASNVRVSTRETGRVDCHVSYCVLDFLRPRAQDTNNSNCFSSNFLLSPSVFF